MSVWTTTAVKRASKRTKAAAKPPELLEKDVQKPIIQLLEASGWIVVRVHVGLFKGWTRNFPVQMNKGKEGFPDLVAITMTDMACEVTVPRVIFIETKRPKGGELSKDQQHWQNHLKALGHEYVLASTFETMQEYLAR